MSDGNVGVVTRVDGPVVEVEGLDGVAMFESLLASGLRTSA